MIIEKIRAENYHSIEDEVLNCEDLTVLVGRNGSGKSSFLRALDLFYNQTPKIDSEDFYNRDTSRDIIISITYKSLSDEAKILFDKYIQNDTLTVQRIFSLKDGKNSVAYHGSTLQNPEFKNLRSAFDLKDRAAQAKILYNGLRQQRKYSSLPECTTKDTIASALKTWESTNPTECAREKDDGQFFGFKSVASGYLGRFTRFLFIPAVRDAAQDAVDGQSSPITELMNLVVRSILASKPELAKLKTDTQQQFAFLMDPSRLTELASLATGMTQTLQNFVPEASIEMAWQKLTEIDFPLPKADTKLNQDGYASPVNRSGHGLQRAFIITALQHLVLAQQKNSTDTAITTLPVLVLAIEEPELYQHPNSQHHLAQILIDIAKGRTPGVAEKTQVIYCTHSPHFVGIDRIDQIRLLKKSNGNPGFPKITKVVEATLKLIAEKIYEITGATGPMYTETTLTPRLCSIMTRSMNEGFFADVAVLVEGEDDVAAIQGYSDALGYDLISQGVSLIPCNGKNCLDRPSVIFQKFGIPTFIVWDSDKGTKDAKKEDNHTMLRLVEESVEDFPSTQVKNTFACFEKNLEATLYDEIGSSDFDTLLNEAQTNFSIQEKKHAIKNPKVISYIVKKAKEQGKSSPTVENIIKKIIELRNQTR